MLSFLMNEEMGETQLDEAHGALDEAHGAQEHWKRSTAVAPKLRKTSGAVAPKHAHNAKAL